MTIERALTEVQGRRVLKSTKTETSDRIVLIHPALRDYVVEHEHFMTNKFVLEDYQSPGVYRHHFVKYCKEHDLKYVPFGNMRSVYATLCGEAGCLDSLVSKSMGHSGKNIRERNYQTTTIKALQFNAEVFVEYLLSGDPDPERCRQMSPLFEAKEIAR